MGTDQILHLFSTILFGIVTLSLFTNWKDKPLFLLTLIVFLSWLVGNLMFDTVYYWGNARITWNIWWVFLGLPFYIAVFCKIYSRHRSPKDLTILFLMLCSMFAQLIQFVDWNFNGHQFMREGKMYIIPLINALITATLVKDVFFKLIDGVAKIFEFSKFQFNKLFRVPNKSMVRLKQE